VRVLSLLLHILWRLTNHGEKALPSFLRYIYSVDIVLSPRRTVQVYSALLCLENLKKTFFFTEIFNIIRNLSKVDDIFIERKITILF
jgi:hypothetical protein